MAINKWMNNKYGMGFNSEQNLTEDLVNELIDLAGITVFYIPRDMVKVDELFQENPLGSFKQYHEISAYVNSVNDFGGSQNLFTKFGLELENSLNVSVGRRNFKELTFMDYPKDGDLLYVPMTKILYKINSVNHEPEISYALSKNYVFELKCNIFDYSYENFNTNIKQVDTELNSDNFTTPYDKTTQIQDEAVEHIDFSESNPFGSLDKP